MSKLKEFLKEDLTELYINVNELVDNLYVRGQEDNFKDEIESIKNFFSYWKVHLKDIDKK